MGLLEITTAAIVPQDEKARENARARLEQLTMPFWALGRIMDLGIDVAGMLGTTKTALPSKKIVVMAGDHGVAAEGVSAYPQEVTIQMVGNFVNGGAGINAVSRVVNAGVVVVDMGVAGDLADLASVGRIVSKKVGFGTRNMAAGPAMTREQAVQAVEAGIEVALDLCDSTDLFGTGDMGIGNTTPSSAVIAAVCGRSAKEVTGRGTGIDDSSYLQKIATIEKALEINRPIPSDGLDVLAKVGGFEIGGIAGLILGAASRRKPILIDGLISTAGALIAYVLCPITAQYMIASHKSVEQGHIVALTHLGKRPLLDLDMRLGEGTGAAMAMPLVDAACAVLTQVATFEEAAVSGAKE
ncbi:MAG: nicotinate-nucleotide--dimethylbenzimidazole phosphoribosyltransferase [Pseudomonadota bacterium]